MTSPPRGRPDDPIKIAEPVCRARPSGFFGRLTVTGETGCNSPLPSGKRTASNAFIGRCAPRHVLPLSCLDSYGTPSRAVARKNETPFHCCFASGGGGFGLWSFRFDKFKFSEYSRLFLGNDFGKLVSMDFKIGILWFKLFYSTLQLSRTMLQCVLLFLARLFIILFMANRRKGNEAWMIFGILEYAP